VFYVIVFSVLAVLLVVAGSIALSRQRRGSREPQSRQVTTKQEKEKRTRKERRAQSRHDRRHR
jgi:hypothetical protein